MRYLPHPLFLIQTLGLGGSLSILAIFISLNGGIDDIYTVFDSQRDIIGTCNILKFWLSHITYMVID